MAATLDTTTISSTPISVGAEAPIGWKRREPPSLDRTVIIEADDLGLLHAFNEGIRQAFREGSLSSTCLRANGYAFDHAVNDVLPSCQGLGIGVHLCLNEADCVAPPDTVPLLLHKGGHGPSYGRLRAGYGWIARLAKSSVGRVQIERELRAQIEKVIDRGIRLDHLNSHQHVHMIPTVFRITCRLANEYGIACVRLSREPAYVAGPWYQRAQPWLTTNAVKHILLNRFARANAPVAAELGIRTTDHFVGVNYTGCMNLNTTVAGLTAIASGSVEVLLHPAIGPDRRDTSYPRPYLRRYVSTPRRAIELKTLTSGELSDFLQRESWRVIDFRGGVQVELSAVPPSADQPSAISRAVATTNPPWVSATFPDSRAFAELAVTVARPGQRALDVGTGTGIVAICLAKAGLCVTATDVSAAAVRNAETNARRNGVEITCHVSDLLDSVDERFDLITINPPYNFVRDTFVGNVAKNLLRRISAIHRSSGTAMPRSVLRFRRQLIRRFFTQVPTRLRPGGGILLLAYQCEVDGIKACLSAATDCQLLSHPDLDAVHTVGMLIHLPAN